MRSLHIDTARTWRGGQNQVLLTVTAMAEAGHDAILLAHEDGELKRRAGEGLRFLGFSPRSEFDMQAAWRLSRVLGDLAPAVVHAHDPMAVALVAMALQMGGASIRRPLVVASRRVDFHLKRHAFSKWKYRHVDVFIAASRLIRSILEDDGIERERIAVVHDAVDIERIDRTPAVDARAAFWLPHGAPVVANVAALAPHKGQKHLVAAAVELVRRVPDARLVILGEGELREPLQHQIGSLGLDRHVLLGGFRSDAIGLMKTIDLFVMSSVTEGLGSVILEAMACRRAVVGTRAGGIPEAVVHGTTGLLVPPRDEPALAGAIATLLADAGLRQRMGEAGRAKVETEFGLDRLVADTLAVYRQHQKAGFA
jgi:glycosyltransferase involved in cell wall biosynthesis